VSWTPEQEAELYRLVADGLTQTAIGQKIGRSLNAINKKLRRTGVDTTRSTCRNGHPYPEGKRHCLVCRRAQWTRWRLSLTDEQRTARNAARRQIIPKALPAPKQSKPTWITEANVTKARQLWDEGWSDARIAAEIGCTVLAIYGYRRKRKWPLREVRGPSTKPALGYSPEQAAKIRELWEAKVDIGFISQTINAIGPAQLTIKQLRHVARRFGLKRPSLRGNKMGLRTPRAHTPKPPRLKSAPIPIPLREVYQRAAQLELPRTKRGDIYALNNAMKHTQPGHPGFVLNDYQPTRLTWTS